MHQKHAPWLPQNARAGHFPLSLFILPLVADPFDVIQSQSHPCCLAFHTRMPAGVRLLFIDARTWLLRGWCVRGARGWVICFPIAQRSPAVVLWTESSVSLILKMPHAPESTKQLATKSVTAGLTSETGLFGTETQ